MTEKFQTVRGMRDLLPPQSQKKQFIEDTCRGVFESFGFEPLQTPVVEDFALLSAKGGGGDAIRDEIYWFKDKSDRELGLRFDLTVPLGRVVASNPQLSKPFKRYQCGTVYRYDRPQAKRYREFSQADADIIGAPGILADFECIQIACELLNRLKIDGWVSVNSRPVLDEIAQACGVKPNQVAECFRCLDKLDKIGDAGVKEELQKCGIGTKIVSVLKENDFQKAKSLLKNSQAVLEFEELLQLVKQSKLEKEVRVDLSLARGLEYYTGFVFEVKTASGPSIGGGGRYDNLVELYGGQATPAVGISFGVDRLLDLVGNQLKISSATQVLLAPLDSKQVSYALRVAATMREAGINVSFDLLSRSLSKNTEFAVKKEIPFVGIVGENEEKRGTVTIKNLVEQKQFEIPNTPQGFEQLKAGLSK